MITETGLWGGPAKHGCLLHDFAHAAERKADAVAVVDATDSLSYQDLMRWINGLTRILAEADVTAGDRVAISGHRSAATVAAMWSVIGRGATYVPLDTSYPVSRLRHMLADSAAKLLLHVGPAPDLDVEIRTMAVPALDVVAPAAPEWPQVKCDPDLPVYVIYTSGSTGLPKGVALPHRSIDNMVRWQQDHSVRPDLRTAQFAPLNFDVWFQEVLGTLCAGGTLWIMPEELRRDPLALLDWLAEHRIERLFLPCMGLHMIALAAAEPYPLHRLRLVEINVAGEQLVCTSAIRDFFQRQPGCRLNNHYGQSESAMVTVHTLPGPSASWPSLPPIGRPLPGCEILHDDETGELVIAGAPLGLGYLNADEANAARYVTVPTTRHGHTRAFRTGDLVRIEDGAVKYVSRADAEVKIRGFRVNPLEVDACLAEHAAVAEAVCVPIDNGHHSRHLRAAVTLRAGATADGRQLRSMLRDTLPSYAVPLSVHVVEELPRTPSGKIDRDAVARQLTENSLNRVSTGNGADDPLLAEIGDVLGRPAVRADEDLLDAGLSSLDALRLTVRLSAHWDTTVTVADVFRARTVRELHDRVAGRPKRSSKIAVGTSAEHAPLTRAQRRFLVGEHLHPGDLDNVVLEIYRVDGPVDIDALHRAVRRVVTRHSALRTVFPIVDGVPVQQILAAEDLHDLLTVVPSTVDPQTLADECVRAGKFRLGSDQPIRFLISSITADRHLLAVHAHHIAIDGRSLRILIEDLCTAYGDVLAGLPPRPRQGPGHADYALWEEQNLPAWIDADLEYWRGFFTTAPPALFPSVSAEGPNRSHAVRLDPGTVTALTRTVNRRGGPPVAALAAATVAALRNVLGAGETGLRLITDGRTDRAFDNVVGYFANPVAVHVTGNGTDLLTD
ncbi:MAG TPA: AMP-binding protein, partial [Actinoplanes sp.]|nr:AMP-binding protein [Actinoplanes sp.]